MFIHFFIPQIAICETLKGARDGKISLAMWREYEKGKK